MTTFQHSIPAKIEKQTTKLHEGFVLYVVQQGRTYHFSKLFEENFDVSTNSMCGVKWKQTNLSFVKEWHF